jgi:membrane peptidoglycan carboxypeptidase
MAGLGGVLAGAMVLPVVAATGILVRNTADKFTTLSVNTQTLPQRSAIYDRLGHLITYVYGVDLGPTMKYTGLNRQPVAYDQISPNMRNAIVAIEDDRFWQHGALDVKGTLRALINDLQHKPVQGGSTLEQQYVKNVQILSELDNPAAQQAATAQNLSRKLDQLRMAVQIAHTMTKPEILAGYLNDAYFDQGAYGVEAAAETYFHTTAAKLTMLQAATLAGIVENPSQYDPVNFPDAALARRNVVIDRLLATDPTALGATPAAAAAEAAGLKAQPLVLRPGKIDSGCSANRASADAFFCDYVIHTILLDKQLGGTTVDRAKLLATGGLQIHTTLAPMDQAAANYAVQYVMPAHSKTYNPAGNADTEVLIQPGTGKIMAIAEDRTYGTGKGQTEVNYAVNTPYGGSAGVQTGSSSKFFTLVTALEQGVPFGFQLTVNGQEVVPGFTNCAGEPVGIDPQTGQAGVFPVVNSEGPGSKSTQSLYTGTVQSINVFFAHLEQKVGLCQVVKTAMALGVTRADGKSLMAQDGKTQPPADDLPTFTLGAVNVSPMSMAAAYATAASGGIYCKPIALESITDSAGKSLPVPSAGCHRAMSQQVAEAVQYVLEGVFTAPGATGLGLGLPNIVAAGKTGTSNVESGNGSPYAAFGGFTTSLAGYVSVFNPVSPTRYTMTGQSACYRAAGTDYPTCPGEMFGAMAPGNTWYVTFTRANLSGWKNFVLPTDPVFWSWPNDSNGQTPIQPPKPKCKGGNGNGGGGNGNGGGNGGGGNCPTGGTGGGGGGGGGTPTPPPPHP